MKVYPKCVKRERESGNFYFGNYGEIPLGISFSTVGEGSPSEINDTLHYHKESSEFYLALRGKGILEVNGEDVSLDPSSLVMVEPGEKHRVKKAVKKPFSWLTVATVKKRDDKVIVEE